MNWPVFWIILVFTWLPLSFCSYLAIVAYQRMWHAEYRRGCCRRLDKLIYAGVSLVVPFIALPVALCCMMSLSKWWKEWEKWLFEESR